MRLALRMCLAVPPAELGAYSKTFKPFYMFLDLSTNETHLKMVISELNPEDFTKLLANVEEGLVSFEVSVSMQHMPTRHNVVASHALLALPGGCSAISAAIVAIVCRAA